MKVCVVPSCTVHRFDPEWRHIAAPEPMVSAHINGWAEAVAA